MIDYSVESLDGFDFICIKNNLDLSICLCDCGASVYSLTYDSNPMILTLKDKKLFLSSNQYFGKTLGLVAGRILSKQIIGGKEVLLKNNQGDSITVHGGPKNLSYVKFKYTVSENKKYIKVAFTYVTRKNDNGFPGKTKVKITYEIAKDSNLINIKFLAIPKEDCIVNLSNHMYFNLGNNDVSAHKLKINASNYLFCNDELLPLIKNEIIEPLDFRKLTKISSKAKIVEKNLPPHTIDHTFLFDEIDSHKKQVILSNDEYLLYVKTDFDACNFYLDNSMTDVEFNNFEGKMPRRGLAIEPQSNLLDPSKVRIAGKQKYEHKSSYFFKKK